MKFFASFLAIAIGSALSLPLEENAGITGYSDKSCQILNAGANVVCDGRCINFYGRDSFQVTNTIAALNLQPYCVTVYSGAYCSGAPTNLISSVLPGVCTPFDLTVTSSSAVNRWVACSPCSVSL